MNELLDIPRAGRRARSALDRRSSSYPGLRQKTAHATFIKLQEAKGAQSGRGEESQVMRTLTGFGQDFGLSPKMTGK